LRTCDPGHSSLIIQSIDSRRCSCHSRDALQSYAAAISKAADRSVALTQSFRCQAPHTIAVSGVARERLRRSSAVRAGIQSRAGGITQSGERKRILHKRPANAASPSWRRDVGLRSRGRAPRCVCRKCQSDRATHGDADRWVMTNEEHCHHVNLLLDDA
jgi:hypothetical protein